MFFIIDQSFSIFHASNKIKNILIMKKLIGFISIFLFFLQVNAQDDLKTVLPKDPSTYIGVLPNGIRYYVRKNSKPENRAELRLAVNVGSTSEDDDQQGLAHLTEHMAFNGSTHFKKNELVDYLESVGTKFGPHLNAYTSFDETVYMIQLPTDKPEIVEKGLQILEDWAHNLSFDSLEVEKERGVVIEEWRLGQGANERLRRKYWPLLFTDSRYANRLPIGKKDIIEKCSQSTLKRFYSDWYRTDLMAVIAVGDFDPIMMVGKIKKEFSDLPKKNDARQLQTYMVPDNKELIIATATDKEARFADVEVIYKQPKESEVTVEDYRRGLAQRLFSSMLDTRMSEILREANPPFINASTSYGKLVRNINAFSSSAICREDGIKQALITLVNENERVLRFGFTKGELERQKLEMMKGMQTAYNERDKTESRNLAREYVSNFLAAESMPGIEYEYNLVKKYLDGISLEEVNAFAKKWITDGKNCIVLITAPEKESTKMPSDAEIKSIVQSMNKLELKPYIDKVSDKPLMSAVLKGSVVTSTNKMDEFNITEWNLPNGVKVFAKVTDFKNDEILFSSFSWGGWSLYSDKDFQSAVISDEIVDESGIGDFDPVALDKKMTGKIVSCSPYISDFQQGFWGSSSPADLETLMQLIYLYINAPRKDTTAFSSWLEKQRGILRNRNTDPQSVFSDTVLYLMSGYNYHYRPRTVESLDEINQQRSFNIYKERFSNANSSTYFFVGNFNIDTLKKFVEKYLGSLPSTQAVEKFKDMGVRTPTGKVEKTVRMGQEPRSTVMLRWNMPFVFARQNRSEVNVLNKLMSIRLREVLREEKSGVYGVSFNSNPQHYPVEKLEQMISFSCSPENVDMLVKAALEIIKEVKQNGCDEKNLVKIKETAIRERETYLKENSFWLNAISSNFQNGEDLHDIFKYNDWVNNLKTTDFVGFAKKYLQEDNYAKLVLAPGADN